MKQSRTEHSEPSGNRRRAMRHKGALPVEMEGGQGITRNFSCSGIFFETDKAFSPGETIEFTIVLEHLDTGGPVRMHYQGEIVRVEEMGGKIGVAAAISSYTLEKA
jgi:hypothetical protein